MYQKYKKLTTIALICAMALSVTACDKDTVTDPILVPPSNDEAVATPTDGEAPADNTASNPQVNLEFDFPEAPASDFEYEKSADGKGVALGRYVGADKEVRIPEKIDGKPVTLLKSKTFTNTTAETVIIPNTVVELEWGAFDYALELKTVVFEGDIKTMGEGAFRGCEKLETVILPDGFTELGEAMFTGCHSLKNIVLPDSLKVIGRSAFWACIALESIVIPHGVTDIGMSAFYMCENLVDIVIPHTVTEIGGSAFSFCTSLVDFVFPDGVKEIGSSMFFGCTSLESVKFGSSVELVLGNIFNDCTSLKTITFTSPKAVSMIMVDIPPSVTAIYVPAGMKDDYANRGLLNYKDIIFEM